MPLLSVGSFLYKFYGEKVMNELQRAHDVLGQLYSKEGYKAGDYIIKAEFPSVLKISSGSDESIEIDFTDNAPVVKIKKIITIRLTILGIVLKRDGGVIKLNRFPDISFTYDNEVLTLLSDEYFEQSELEVAMYFSQINQDIDKQYKTDKDKKFAKKCLQLGEDWTRIVSGGFADFDRFKVPAGADPKKYKKALASECKSYIKNGLSPDDTIVFVGLYTFFWVLPFALQIAMSVMISWIVTKMLEKLFKKD